MWLENLSRVIIFVISSSLCLLRVQLICFSWYISRCTESTARRPADHLWTTPPPGRCCQPQYPSYPQGSKNFCTRSHLRPSPSPSLLLPCMYFCVMVNDCIWEKCFNHSVIDNSPFSLCWTVWLCFMLLPWPELTRKLLTSFGSS